MRRLQTEAARREYFAAPLTLYLRVSSSILIPGDDALSVSRLRYGQEKLPRLPITAFEVSFHWWEDERGTIDVVHTFVTCLCSFEPLHRIASS